MADGIERERAADLSLSEQAHRLIRKAILSGELEGGQRIKMEDLKQRYSFSSSPLREALNRLAAEGLVVTDNHRGFRAASISVDDISDITAFRLVIECDALAQSVAGGDDDWEADIIAAFHRLDRIHAREAGSQPLSDEWTARHKAFHMALVAACPSQRQLATCSSLFDQAERYRRLSISIRQMKRDSMSEHRTLMDVALARDAEAAAKLLQEHILRTSNNVVEMLSNRALMDGPSAERVPVPPSEARASDQNQGKG